MGAHAVVIDDLYALGDRYRAALELHGIRDDVSVSSGVGGWYLIGAPIGPTFIGENKREAFHVLAAICDVIEELAAL